MTHPNALPCQNIDPNVYLYDDRTGWCTAADIHKKLQDVYEAFAATSYEKKKKKKD